MRQGLGAFVACNKHSSAGMFDLRQFMAWVLLP